MLDLLHGHRLGDERDFDLFALLEHAFRAGRGTGVDINSHIRRFLQESVYACHEAAQQESRVIQVDKDEAIGGLLADRTSDRINCGLFQEGFIAFKSKSFLEQRNQIGAADE